MYEVQCCYAEDIGLFCCVKLESEDRDKIVVLVHWSILHAT